jgi:glycine/D-amino acid oxidase-like deaminating enzyme
MARATMNREMPVESQKSRKTRGAGRQTYDVIVVGGGVVGCSIAYRLAQAGQKVVLLEQRDICSGASGRNGGLTGEGSALHAAAGNAVYNLTSANLRLLGELSAELGVDFQLKRPGTLDIATTQAQWEHLETAVRAQRSAGLDVDLLDAHETRKLMPAVSPDIIGSKLARGHGHLWPFALVHGFAAAAQRYGADIRTGTTVQRHLRHGSQVTGVLTSSGAIEAGHVVLATNAYTPLLLPELPEGSIVPARGQILVTQPMPPMLAHPFGTNFDKEYGRQVPGGPILCGGFRRLDEDEGLGHYEERVTLPVLSGIAKCLTGLFPSLRQVQVVRCWAGVMGFTADGVPLIGQLDETPGLTIAAGFNGGGFSWGAITGKIITALLTGKSVEFDLTPFRPSRFAESGVDWSNPFTAGERS